uniref:beta-fructofuranosidase n=1 Tax=Oryza rufipogon TaxID=4529 RepID=A0A0E0QNM1_ORYRU
MFCSFVISFGGGGRACITARVYPEHVATSSSHLYVFNNGSDAVKVAKLEAWDLATATVNWCEKIINNTDADDSYYHRTVVALSSTELHFLLKLLLQFRICRCCSTPTSTSATTSGAQPPLRRAAN